MKIKILLFLGISILFRMSYGQSENFRFKALLNEQPETPAAFAIVPYDGLLAQLLTLKEVKVKQVTKDWIYVQATPSWLNAAQKSGLVKQFYFEFSNPKALNDTSLVTHYVKPVHDGAGGLQTPFTGKDVIIGYVDEGIDWTHQDFKNPDGTTRVLYYWDHNMPVDPDHTPQPYGYGQVFYASDINAGTCPAIEGYPTAHGTSVAGAGSSNGSANGREKGMAPDSKIIMVETNFNLPNWTLTVADACDFIFAKADSLGLPAVINLSVGSYLGSHDGDDPAAMLMESLLDESPGRIIVCAAGNSGAWGRYHVQGTMDTDTSFVWIIPNPSSQLGPNTCYMDVWTDVTDATWSYSFGANLPNGTYEERAETQYRPATTMASIIRDTLWNGSNQLATVEIYPEIVGNNLHIEYFFSTVDSAAYYYSFKTTGSGKYDAWTGSPSIGLNNMEFIVPSAAVFPDIVNYLMPDTLQTIVSSWNCSEKVITVGNVRNRYSHLDGNNNPYLPAPSYPSAVGELSVNSSKGPSRHNVVKPDVSACGDVSLSAGPTWILTNPAYYASISDDHLHVRNGGTSMASPIVAGIAALYLEKCRYGTYQTFKNDLITTAFTDGFTGTVPNYAYGYGKPHALNLLLESNYLAQVVGASPICENENLTASSAHGLQDVLWTNADTTIYLPVTTPGSYSYVGHDVLGCVVYSDTLDITVVYPAPPVPVITANGPTLSTADYPDLQWCENGSPIFGETNDTLIITLPSSSNFTVRATSVDGCMSESAPYNPSLGVEDYKTELVLFPNPANNSFVVQTTGTIQSISVSDISGKVIMTQKQGNKVDCSTWSKGAYFVRIQLKEEIQIVKFVKE